MYFNVIRTRSLVVNALTLTIQDNWQVDQTITQYGYRMCTMAIACAPCVLIRVQLNTRASKQVSGL